MSYPTLVPNWLQVGLGLTAAQVKNQPNFQKLCAAIAGSIQDLEAIAIGMLAGRELATAVGQTLDNIGTIVGQPRNGMVDGTYRVWLYARILLNRSSGTIPQLIAIFAALGSTATVVTEYQPASIIVAPNFPIPNAAAPLQAYSSVLGEARADGVSAQLLYSSDVDANMLWLSDASVSYAASQASGLGPGLSDTNNPTSGGQLAGIVQGV